MSRTVVELTAAEIAPAGAAVLGAQGIPEEAEVGSQVEELLRDAMERLTALAQPVALVARVSPGQFARIFRGAGRNSAFAPLDEIYPRADRLDLFAGTLGQPIADEIQGLLDRHDFAAAVMLDGAASCAAERLVERLEERLARETGLAVLGYSPGYCGWHVSGQQALFDVLEPSRVGIALTPSFLMEPLKSVSGVLVAGRPDIHEFDDDFACCAECATRECRVRMARIREV